MNAQPAALPMKFMHVPTADEAHSAVRHAHELFNRTLAAWASDILILRKHGLDRINWTPASNECSWAWSKAA